MFSISLVLCSCPGFSSSLSFSGLFSGFEGSGRERFKLAVRSGEGEEICVADRLVLPPDSAQSCLEFMTSKGKYTCMLHGNVA